MARTVLEAHDIGVRFTLHHGISPLKNALNVLSGRMSKDANYFWALRNVSLKVEEGEIVGVVGRNGAGKSTLFLVLSQILDLDEGALRVEGEITTLLTIGAGFRADLTGRENLYLSAALLGLNRAQIEKIEQDIIAFAELEKFIDEPIKNYSSGMKARLGFATAVHVNPDILLLDEVLSVGDESFRDKSHAKIQEVMKSARAILMVSHSLDVIRTQCSRVLWLESGNIRVDGDPIETVRAYVEFCRDIRRKTIANPQQTLPKTADARH